MYDVRVWVGTAPYSADQIEDFGEAMCTAFDGVTEAVLEGAFEAHATVCDLPSGKQILLKLWEVDLTERPS